MRTFLPTLATLSTLAIFATGADAHAASPCELDTPRACLERGLQRLEATPPDPEGALPWVVKSCDAGWPDGCAELGFLHMQGIGVAVDDAKAFAFSKKACDMGSGLGCKNAAVMARDGRGVAADDKLIKDFADKSCKLDLADGCFLLGAAYDEGRGVKADPKKALAALDRACTLEHGEACALVARRYFNGAAGAKKSIPTAIARFERACDLGRGAVCTMLGVSYYDGDEGIARDPVKAVAFFAKACALHDEDGCSNQKVAEDAAAQPPQPRAAKTTGTLLTRKGASATLLVGAAEPLPPLGSEGQISKTTEVAGFQASLVIGRVRVVRAGAGRLDLTILEESSAVIIDGKKLDHWTKGSALTLEWNAP